MMSEQVGSGWDDAEKYLQHLQGMCSDEPMCTVCDGEGCGACVYGIRPDVIETIYQRGRTDEHVYLRDRIATSAAKWDLSRRACLERAASADCCETVEHHRDSARECQTIVDVLRGLPE